MSHVAMLPPPRHETFAQGTSKANDAIADIAYTPDSAVCTTKRKCEALVDDETNVPTVKEGRGLRLRADQAEEVRFTIIFLSTNFNFY